MAETPENSAPKRVGRLWRYFRRYLSWYVTGAVFLILTNVLTLEIPRLLGRAVQSMRETTDVTAFDLVSADVVHAATLIIWLAVGAGLARVLSRIAIFNAGRFVEFDLRNELYTRLTTLGPRFYGSMPTGDLTSRVANDVTFVRVLFAVPFLHTINAALAYGIALRKMLALDVSLTLLALAPYPILLLALRQVIRAMFEQTKIVQAQLSTISSKVQENLSGMAMVKTYVLESLERRRFGALNEEYVDKNMRLALYRGVMGGIISLIAGSGTLLVLLFGTRRVVAGEMTLGTFVEFNGYVVALAFPTIAMGWVLSVWHRGLAAFDRVSEVLHTEPDIGSPAEPAAGAVERGGAEIVFDHVTFTYPTADRAEPALTDVTFTIPGGSTVAFVGRTGAGKSTLVKLLCRLYDPDQGTVRIDGVPLWDRDLRELRSDLGVVPQNPFLFSMSVRNNLRFGLDALEHDDTIARAAPPASLKDGTPAASQDVRVAEALEIAGLSADLDSFPEGLETLVGERGITLSGGQKQRVTIARALLVDPRILVLDDALSSVDTKTEAAILEHLETVMAGRTSILITHRFNALPRVDRIFVLERGRIVEEGTHDELVSRGGVYAAMWARQQLAEELEGG